MRLFVRSETFTKNNCERPQRMTELYAIFVLLMDYPKDNYILNIKSLLIGSIPLFEAIL